MSFDPELECSVADSCFNHKVADSFQFYLLVHVEDYACGCSHPKHFEARLKYFRVDPESDSFLDVKMLGDVTNLLQVRIIRTQSTLCLDQERRISQLAAEYGVQDCKLTLTPMEPRYKLYKSSNTPLVSIPLRQLVGSQM